MDNININKSIQPSTTNTPLDARTVVDTEIDIRNIKLPYVGMFIYVKDTGKTYQVKSLKEGILNTKTIPDLVVGTYEEFSSVKSIQDLEGYNELVESIKMDIINQLSIVSSYGYINDNGMYQPITTDDSGNSVENGDPQALDNLYVYDSGKPDPEY